MSDEPKIEAVAMMKYYVPPKSLHTFTVEIRKPPKDGYNAYPETIATGLARRDAAELAGMLLMSPLYESAKLIEEFVPGRWEDA